MESTYELSKLATILEAANMTFKEAARIGGVTEVTVSRWFTKRRTPSAAMVRGVREAVERSATTRIRLRDGHHLFYKPDAGWFCRATLQISKKEVGKRVKRSLGTHDMLEAIKRRDLLVAEWNRLGLTVANRLQKPHRKGGASRSD